MKKIILIVFAIVCAFSSFVQAETKPIKGNKTANKLNTVMLRCDVSYYYIAHENCPAIYQQFINEDNNNPKKDIMFFRIDFNKNLLLKQDSTTIAKFNLYNNVIKASYVIDNFEYYVTLDRVTGLYSLYQKTSDIMDTEIKGFCKPYDTKPIF